MSMHVGPSMPACFASPGALHFVPFCPILSHLDRRVPTANDATYPPKTAESSPTTTCTEVQPKEIVSGDAGGQELAPIDAGLK